MVVVGNMAVIHTPAKRRRGVFEYHPTFPQGLPQLLQDFCWLRLSANVGRPYLFVERCCFLVSWLRLTAATDFLLGGLR